MLKAMVCSAALLVLLAAPLRAQGVGTDSVAVLDLPEEVAQAVVEFFNDPRHLRFAGPTTLAAGDTTRADVAVLGGPLVLGGHVEGTVVVVNGDVRLLPGASIAGDLRVVGGSVAGADSARVAGEVESYPERLRFRRDGYRIVRVGRGRAGGGEVEIVPARGRSDFLLTTGNSYNRVEGLPITFGPRIQTEGSNPLRVQALAVYRTEAGFTLDTDDMGYYVRAEQFLGGRRALRVGATAHSLVDPIEDWHVSDLENGLSTFLFHRDFRDHFEREGVSAFSTWEPRRGPLSLTAEARWERHRSRAAGSPVSLFDNGEPWRPQPLVAEGRVATLGALLAYDTRSDQEDPATGWYARGRFQQSFSSDLVLPGAVPAGLAVAGATEGYPRFTTAFIDVRRYNRVDPRSRLDFRLLAAGPLHGGSLPPQWQHALGGEGSLPGYELFSLDCGARERPAFRSAAEASDPAAPAFFPRYGCDAFALLQAEFRGKLNFRLLWDDVPWRDDETEDDDRGWGIGWDFSPDWVFFADAGRGWRVDGGADEELAVDVGVGLLVDRVGLFVALPLAGDQGLNLFVRLGRRF